MNVHSMWRIYWNEYIGIAVRKITPSIEKCTRCFLVETPCTFQDLAALGPEISHFLLIYQRN